MTHITLSKKTTLKPSLEFYSDGCSEPRRVTIEQFPFRIGRAETANLRVESAEVSREHAEIVERNGMWLVRDLGSTNGTQVNGKQIKETLLTDGDILKVAETELTFIASAASQFQRMVTQPVPSKRVRTAPAALAPEIAAARMLTEATLWQAIPLQLFAATSLRHEVIEAHFAIPTPNDQQSSLLEQPCAVGERYRELERMRAAELATEWPDASRLFFTIGADANASPHRLLANLTQHALLPVGWELGITLSLPTDVDILSVAEIYREARNQSLLVAFDKFQGNGSQVMHLESFPPDYLVLAASMTKDLTSASRQPMRRLESLLTACNELSIKPILPPRVSDDALSLCQELGFDLMLQLPTRRAATPAAALSASV